MGQDILDSYARYVYREDLRELDSTIPEGGVVIPEGISQITTPLRLNSWAVELHNHPDAVFAEHILSGIQVCNESSIYTW